MYFIFVFELWGVNLVFFAAIDAYAQICQFLFLKFTWSCKRLNDPLTELDNNNNKINKNQNTFNLHCNIT